MTAVPPAKPWKVNSMHISNLVMCGLGYCIDAATLLRLCRLVQVRVELSDEQRELYKAILGRNYEALVGEYVQSTSAASATQRQPHPGVHEQSCGMRSTSCRHFNNLQPKKPSSWALMSHSCCY